MIGQISDARITSESKSTGASPSFSHIIDTETGNGGVKVREHTIRTQIGLAINLLAAPGLVTWELQNSIPTATLTLTNDQLGDETSICSAISAVGSAEERKILTEAFEYLKDDSEVYDAYWKPEVFQKMSSSDITGPFDEVRITLEDLFEQTGLKTSEYFSLLHERNVARNLLLEQQTLQYKLDLRTKDYAASTFDNSVFVTTSDNVRWDIKVYKVFQAREPEIIYYRFVIRAVSEPYEFLIPTTSLDSLEVAANACLQKESGQKIPINVGECDLNLVISISEGSNAGADNELSPGKNRALTLSLESGAEVDATSVFSVDLSQRLDDDQEFSESVIATDLYQGGAVGELANAIVQDQMLALVSFEASPELGDSLDIEFTRTHIDIGCQFSENSESVMDNARFSVVPEGSHFRFLSKGCYEGQLNASILNNLDNYQLVINGQEPGINEEGRFRYEVNVDTLQKMKLQMIRK